MLGKTQNQTRTKRNLIFLNVNKGKIEHLEPGGGKNYFDYVEGIFSRIVQKERNFHGETVLYWYVNFDEPGSENTYSVAFPYGSNVFKSVILALASASSDALSLPIRLEPWLKGEFTNVTLYAGETRLDWITKDLPEVKTMRVGGKVIKDDSERMQFITNYVNMINDRKGIRDLSGRRKEPEFTGDLFAGVG